MSDTLNAARDALAAKLDGQTVEGSVKFEIEGEGAIRVEGDAVTLDEAEADCTLKADHDTFREMLAGDLNPTAAFMGGRLSVDGDMGLAMKLGAMLA